MKAASSFCVFLFIVLAIGCKNRRYKLDIDSQFNGWIYIVQSKDSLKIDVFSPDPNGIAYVPKDLFEVNAQLDFMIDGKSTVPKKIKVYDVVFYPKGGTRKVVYKKFYFPFTSREINEKLYSYAGRDYQEFEYFYETNRIDTASLEN